jgi:hypothetical protein
MYCRVCGNLLEENDLICKVCGADIQEQQRRTDGETAFVDILPDGQADSVFPRGDADEMNAFATHESVLSHEASDGGEAVFSDMASDGGEAVFSDIASDGGTPAIDPDAIEREESGASEAADPEIAAELATQDTAPAARRETIAGEFQWNIHRFPSAEIRKTEDIDFDWNISPATPDSQTGPDDDADRDADVPAAAARADIKSLEDFFELCAHESEGIAAGHGDDAQGGDAGGSDENDAGGLDENDEHADLASAFIGLDAQREADAALQQFFAEKTEDPRDAEGEKRDDAPAWLHAESAPDVFGYSLKSDAGMSNRDRFFTFDKKNEEFQRLLDREYERLQTYNSPIVNKARAMVATWDLPVDFANKRTNPATKRWTPFMFRDRPKREDGRDDTDAPPRVERDESENASNATNVEEIAAASADVAGVEALTAGAATAPQDADIPATEEAIPEVASEEKEAIPEAASEEKEAIPEVASEEKEAIPEVAPEEKETPEISEDAEGAASEDTAATEAELSISKTLDSIEQGIEEWESRERFSTASKVAIVISIIFLLFTGGSAAVKHFLPHSPADVWFDSVQLRMAATIKHGVDAIRDLFDGSDVTDHDDAEGDAGDDNP